MPPNTNQPLPKSSVQFKKILYIGAFLVLAALAVWYGVLKKGEARKFNPQGTILLTLSNKGSDDVGIYTFDIASKTLAPYFAPVDIKSITASRLPSEATTMLLATNAVVPTRGSLFQIATYNKGKDLLQPVTKSTVTFKRHPSYSEALQLFVYGGKDPASTTLSGTASEFNVYTLDHKGVEKKIGQGSIPTLTPDGKSVVVMRKDGLSMLDLITGKSEVIWPLTAGAARTNQQFTVSQKGTYLAWSNPYEGVVYVLQVKSWQPFQAVAAPQKIHTYAFWPHFSPDETYLVLQEVDIVDAIPVRPRLVIYDLLTQEKKIIQDLDAFVQERMFVSDWY